MSTFFCQSRFEERRRGVSCGHCGGNCMGLSAEQRLVLKRQQRKERTGQASQSGRRGVLRGW